MKIVLVTDAWQPQVNGVVTTLVELVRELQEGGHEVVVIHPGQFRTRPCPGYAGIDLAMLPGRALTRMLKATEFDAIHTVERALRVGSVDRIISARELRPFVVDALERGMARCP